MTTVHDALETVENDEQIISADIIMLPPNENGNISEEDSDDENNAGDANHLSSRQLTAPAEMLINYGDYVTHLNTPSEETVLKPPQLSFNWKEYNRGGYNSKVDGGKKEAKISEFSPASIFELFFDNEVIDMIVTYTNLYAHQDKLYHDFSINAEEIRKFICVLIISGYSILPQTRLYWSSGIDVGNEAISSLITCNRFEKILSVLHLSDNSNLNSEDKFSKIRPFYSLLNEKCLNGFSESKNLSVDESMLPYFGHHCSKQRIANKPVRMGYKVWVLAESSGYVVQFEPYQGARLRTCRSSAANFGLGESVVIDLISELPNSANYHIYMDNFFTSFRLLNHLFLNNIEATGVLRQNKLSNCPIIDPKQLMKKERGYSQQLFDETNNLTIVGWKDSKAVYVASNCMETKSPQSTSRWSKADKKNEFL